MAACLEAKSSPANVSWNFAAMAASGVYDPLAGLRVHLLRRMCFACFSGLGLRWMDLAAKPVTAPWDEHGVVKTRNTPARGGGCGDAISDTSNGNFRDAMKLCKEAVGTVGDPTAAAVS
jgi:hypothetical protein